MVYRVINMPSVEYEVQRFYVHLKEFCYKMVYRVMEVMDSISESMLFHNARRMTFFLCF